MRHVGGPARVRGSGEAVSKPSRALDGQKGELPRVKDGGVLCQQAGNRHTLHALRRHSHCISPTRLSKFLAPCVGKPILTSTRHWLARRSLLYKLPPPPPLHDTSPSRSSFFPACPSYRGPSQRCWAISRKPIATHCHRAAPTQSVIFTTQLFLPPQQLPQKAPGTMATPASHPFTCNTCQVAFRASELQRAHMQTDWQ